MRTYETYRRMTVFGGPGLEKNYNIPTSGPKSIPERLRMFPLQSQGCVLTYAPVSDRRYPRRNMYQRIDITGVTYIPQ